MNFQHKEEIEPELIKRLDSLKRINIEHNLETETRTRAAYFANVEKIAVSKTTRLRPTYQNHIKQLIGFGKERFTLSPTFISIMVAFVLFFGGGGISVAAAQNSLPDNILYPVKLLTEDINEMLTIQPQEKMNLEMDFSQTRLEEIGTLLKRGNLPEDAIFTRLQNHLMIAFQLAAEADPQDSGELLRLQNRLQEQIQIMEQLQINGNAPVEAALLRTRDMLQTQVRLVDESLANSSTLRNELQEQDRDQIQNTNQNMVENQNQDTVENQNQDMIQNQNQDMIQNQNQDMIRNQNQDMIQNQNQDMIQNQNSNQDFENGFGNDNEGGFSPTPVIENESGNSDSNQGNGGGGGRK